jgi:bifunctional non-homologous end joining protein LigD
MSLQKYQEMRDFRMTPEPKGKVSRTNKHRFVCQEHHASSLHFDFRLEIGGVLKSWSLRKGPSMNPSVRRLAVPTEDHPVEYADFQGDIPEGNYGAGQHRIWDKGTFELLSKENPVTAFEKGTLKIELKGKRLKGAFNLFRLGSQDQWLLVKSKDEHAEADWRLELLLPDKNGGRYIEEKQTADGRSKKTTKKANKISNHGVVTVSAQVRRGEKLPAVGTLLKRKELKGDVRAKVGDYALEFTSLNRVYWPDNGFTKADLIRYYFQMSRYILPYLENRPLILKRYPNGIEGNSFHQHDVDRVPEFVKTVALEAEDGGSHQVDYVVGGNLQTHLYLANLAAIERHPWHSRVGNLNCPDWFVFDLDPGEKVDFEQICEVALVSREVIEGFGLTSYAKTSGSRGIHVYVPVKPVYPYKIVAELATKLAKEIVKASGKAATVERRKASRKPNQVYVDHMQNSYGKSVVAPYSVRPRPGATVSAPVTWKEIEKRSFDIRSFTIETILKRVREERDLFKPALTKPLSLDEAFERTRVSK